MLRKTQSREKKNRFAIELPAGRRAADADDGSRQKNLVPEGQNRKTTRELHRFRHPYLNLSPNSEAKAKKNKENKGLYRRWDLGGDDQHDGKRQKIDDFSSTGLVVPRHVTSQRYYNRPMSLDKLHRHVAHDPCLVCLARFYLSPWTPYRHISNDK